MTELSAQEAMLLDAYTINVAFDYELVDEQSQDALFAHVQNVAQERAVETDLDAMLLILQEFYQGPLTDDPEEILDDSGI